MGEGRVPSTRNARTVDQRGAGTGQHTEARVDIGEGLTFPRADDSPSKVTGKAPSPSESRRGETTPSEVATPDMERNAKMVKDTGSKTPREREFDAEMLRRRKADSTVNERSFYPDALEDMKTEFAKGDGHTATKAAFRPKKAQ